MNIIAKVYNKRDHLELLDDAACNSVFLSDVQAIYTDRYKYMCITVCNSIHRITFPFKNEEKGKMFLAKLMSQFSSVESHTISVDELAVDLINYDAVYYGAEEEKAEYLLKELDKVSTINERK